MNQGQREPSLELVGFSRSDGKSSFLYHNRPSRVIASYVGGKWLNSTLKEACMISNCLYEMHGRAWATPDGTWNSHEVKRCHTTYCLFFTGTGLQCPEEIIPSLHIPRPAYLFIFQDYPISSYPEIISSYHDLHLDVDLQSVCLRRFAKNFVCLFNVCKFEVWGKFLVSRLFQDVRASGSHTVCYHGCDVQLSSFEKIEQHR